MRVNARLIPLIVIVALLGTVVAANAAGLWATSGKTSVNLSTLKPTDIKGWMTLQQVIDGIGIRKDELYPLVNLPADLPTSTALKEIEKLVEGFETSTLREVLTVWLEGQTPK